MRGGISLAFAALLLVPAGLAAAPAGAQVWQTTDHELREEIARQAPKELRAFYAARNNRPIWLDAEARPGPALELLYGYLESAEVEGIDPRKLKLRDLTRALDKAESRDSDDLARLDVTASRVFAGYVDAVRRTPPAPMIYESAALAPVVPTSAATLQTAAAAPDLAGYLRDMRWMHPLYAPIRQALTAPQYDPGQRRQLQLSLDRVRALPAMQSGRHVLIDAASARLWMYEGTQVVGTMRVVVGKPETQTQDNDSI